MNPEHLELYRKLSATKIFKERFGDFRKGDPYWDSIACEIDYFDAYFDLNEDGIPYYDRCSPWLPPVFDPERPERSLLGMLGSTNIDYVDNEEAYLHCAYEIGPDRLDVALVKTILAQEASHD